MQNISKKEVGSLENFYEGLRWISIPYSDTYRMFLMELLSTHDVIIERRNEYQSLNSISRLLDVSYSSLNHLVSLAKDSDFYGDFVEGTLGEVQAGSTHRQPGTVYNVPKLELFFDPENFSLPVTIDGVEYNQVWTHPITQIRYINLKVLHTSVTQPIQQACSDSIIELYPKDRYSKSVVWDQFVPLDDVPYEQIGIDQHSILEYLSLPLPALHKYTIGDAKNGIFVNEYNDERSITLQSLLKIVYHPTNMNLYQPILDFVIQCEGTKFRERQTWQHKFYFTIDQIIALLSNCEPIQLDKKNKFLVISDNQTIRVGSVGTVCNIALEILKDRGRLLTLKTSVFKKYIPDQCKRSIVTHTERIVRDDQSISIPIRYEGWDLDSVIELALQYSAEN
jgi:hypothetical protein